MSVHPKRKFRTGHASLEPLLSLVPRSPFWPLAEARSSPSHVGSQGQTGRRFSLGPTAAFDLSATWAGSADQLAVPADESTVAFMRLKRAVDAVDETLPDSGRVEQMFQMLPSVSAVSKNKCVSVTWTAKLLPNVRECIVPSSRLTVTCSPFM